MVRYQEGLHLHQQIPQYQLLLGYQHQLHEEPQDEEIQEQSISAAKPQREEQKILK